MEDKMEPRIYSDAEIAARTIDIARELNEAIEMARQRGLTVTPTLVTGGNVRIASIKREFVE
jgi:hypothetical protein